MGLSKEEKSAKCQILTKFSIKISLVSFENPSSGPHRSAHLCWKGAHGTLHNVGIRDTGKIVTFQNTEGGRTASRQRKCMKMWRLGRKQRGKWRPNSLGPSCFFSFYTNTHTPVYYFSLVLSAFLLHFLCCHLALCCLLEQPL